MDIPSSVKNFSIKKNLHFLYLLYWPVYFFMFYAVERLFQPEHFYTVHSRLDDIIPFNEWFLIPYVFWYLYLGGTCLYMLLFEPDCFARMMRFISLTFTLTIALYLVFPNVQDLRPAEFANQNIFTSVIGYLYSIDPPNNVCPSLHVIGSFAAMFAAFDSKVFKLPLKIIYAVLAVLISFSTAFIKQHSILDVAAGAAMSLLGYSVIYILIEKIIKKKREKSK